MSPEHPGSGSEHQLPADVRSQRWRDEEWAFGERRCSRAARSLAVGAAVACPLQIELAWQEAGSPQAGSLHARLAARASCLAGAMLPGARMAAAILMKSENLLADNQSAPGHWSRAL